MSKVMSKKLNKKADTPLCENKAELREVKPNTKVETATPSHSVGVVVIKPYDGIEIGTKITNPDTKLFKYMTENGFWK